MILGKALSGGVYPVSAVLADNAVMMNLKPGQHGSTYGGNPVAARVAIEVVNVLLEEKLPENAAVMGEVLLQRLRELPKDVVLEVRGRGLMCAIILDKSERMRKGT